MVLCIYYIILLSMFVKREEREFILPLSIITSMHSLCNVFIIVTRSWTGSEQPSDEYATTNESTYYEHPEIKEIFSSW